MPVELSVVIPAYNEAPRLETSLERILAYLRGRGETFEVLVVDDGSTDRTAEIAEQFSSCGVWLLRLAGNRGKGAALRHGVVASQGRKVLLTDADLSTPIHELEKLEPRLVDCELVLGSRGVPDSNVVEHQPRYREFLGRAFNLLLRLLGVTRLRDTQCGFKLLDGEVARSLFPSLTVDRYAYDVELVYKAERRGCSTAEVGVEWRDSDMSKVRPFRDGIRMIVDVARIRLGMV